MPKRPVSQSMFYGWFVVAACFAATATLGEALYGFGIFFKPLENEFAWNRSLTSSAYTMFLIGFSISSIITGRLADRFKPRFILLFSGLVAGLGISLASQVNDINQLRFVLCIAGLGSGATSSVPLSSVQRWFHNRPHAGAALALVSSGSGAGGLIFTNLINTLILAQGWRGAFLTLGIIFFTVIAIASLVIKPSPQETPGLGISNSKGEVNPKISASGWTISKALTSPGFIALLLIFSFGAVSFHTMSVHLVPHATDLGVSATIAAAALGLMGGLSIPGRILSGFISDKMSWQRVLVISYLGMALSFIWLLLLQAAWMLYGVVFIYGLFMGARMVATVGIISEFFGMRSIGALTGITIATGNLVGAIAPYAAGYIFDATGSYSIAFIIVTLLLLISGAIALVIKKPSAKGLDS